jgi:hypothetical protein
MAVGNEFIPWGAAIAGDVMSALQIPGSNTLGRLADAHLQRKRRLPRF